MAKRSRQPKYRQEEEEEYAESETGFPSADDESDEDLLGVREEELVPVAPKKKKLNNINGGGASSSTMMLTDNSKHRQRKAVVSKQSKGSKSLVISQEVDFVDIDNIDLSDIRDSPRQIILKKKDFPSQLVGYITNATRVNFSKDKSKPTNDREEIVVNIVFMFDLLNKKLIREIDAYAEESKVNYVGIEIRFHLPRRYQDKFQNIADLSFLIGALLVVPAYDATKWRKDKDENQSTIPIIMMLKNRKCCEGIGMVIDEYPTLVEFHEESARSIEDDYTPTEGAFDLIISHFKNECDSFTQRESHITNRLYTAVNKR